MKRNGPFWGRLGWIKPAAWVTFMGAIRLNLCGTRYAPSAAVSYANCTAVKAAGAAPLYAGQPGYSTSLDRDRDGVACEK